MSEKSDEGDFVPLQKAATRETRNVRRILASSRNGDASLFTRCCAVIAAHLERYPPESFGLLDESSWNAVVKMRHRSTKPAKGSGGLDGTGRVAPAITAKFMAEVEEQNPHLCHSEVADSYVWKDCVNYKFKEGGHARPIALMYPFPILIDKVSKTGLKLIDLLQSEGSRPDRDTLQLAITLLCRTPMNVNLLQSSGIGKSVKKFLKACHSGKVRNESLVFEKRPVGSNGLTGKPAQLASPVSQLEGLLQQWKDMAANNGVAMSSSATSPTKADGGNENEAQRDLLTAETCQTWRALFHTLDHRESERRANQGARMREIRKNLKNDRRQVKGVRPASNPRHEAILQRQLARKTTGSSSSSWSSGPKPAMSKIQQLRKETAMAASRQQNKKRKPEFGGAVAFANAGRSKRQLTFQKTKPLSTSMDGKKRMGGPTMVPKNGSRGHMNLKKKLKKGR